MSSIASSYNRLLQCVSYAINRHSNLPLVSRFQIYDALRDYTMEQEFRIQQLEKKVQALEMNSKQNNNHSNNNINNKECVIYEEKQKNVIIR